MKHSPETKAKISASLKARNRIDPEVRRRSVENVGRASLIAKAKFEADRAELAALRVEVVALREENTKLKADVKSLRAEIARLGGGSR